jgi:hypothetical protein
MLTKRIVPTLTAAAALLAVGCAPAASSAATTSATTGAHAATAAAAGGSAVHFSGYSLNSDGPDLTVVLSGAIGDYGPAVSVHPNGTVDPDHSSELKLDLKKGTLRLDVAALDKKFVAATGQWGASPTCSFHASATGATPVVPGSGTGAYRGASGSITMTLTVDEVDTRPCPAGSTAFISQIITLTGAGHVSR